MRSFAIATLLAGAAAIGGCGPVAEPATAANTVCGTYGYMDVNNDGFITGDEWNTYRTNAYGFWDVNKDGRIDRSEFENCWRGGGFYREAYYNPDYWTNYWTAFDANADGYLGRRILVRLNVVPDRPKRERPHRFQRMGLVAGLN